MDIVHHAFIGGVGFLSLAAQDQELAGLGFLVGSVFPDLDVALMVAGKLFYLKHHQGPSHSLAMASLYAAMLASISVPQLGWNWALYSGLLAGLSVHILLDLFNTFGIQLLWPLTTRRFCLDAVFFIDPVAWGMTAGFFLFFLTGRMSAGLAALGYTILLSVYLLVKLILQRRTRKRLGADFAIPSALNPFGFFLFTQRDGQLRTAKFNVLTGRMTQKRILSEVAPEIAGLSGQSGMFLQMRSILRGLHITSADENPVGITIVAEDLVVRNFGGRFGRTELRFDTQGKLTDEMAHI